MKKILFLTVLLSASAAFAEDGKNDWHDTTLSDATIKKIQAAQYQYKKCVSAEMQKFAQQDMDSRNATDVIMKQCESVLSQMREVYLAEKVPDPVADRHLKQMRIQTTRNVLQGMIFNEAARKSGQQ
jgi:phage terminase large subunit GpA-like protein